MRVDRGLLAILLALSVVANLFLGGVLAGAVLAPRAEGGGAWAPGRQVRRLEPDERLRFMQAMAPYRRELRGSRQAVRRARAQVEADIAAPAYDRARLTADFAALRQAAAAQQVATHAALVDALGRLTPASRQALVAGPGRVGNAAAAR